MKKVYLLLMVFVMILNMTSCGKKEEVEDVSSQNYVTNEGTTDEMNIEDSETVVIELEEIVLPEEPIFELEEIEEEKMISQNEIPNLIRGIKSYEELEFCVKVMETKRLSQLERNFSTIQNGLEIIWHEPIIENVYSPIKGTRYSYDVDELNRIFNAITTDRIYSEEIPEGATLEGNIITFKPYDQVPENRVGIRILRMYYDDENNICIDFNFKKLYNSEGTSYREGTTLIYFTPSDETGEYKSDYLREYNSREVNVNE